MSVPRMTWAPPAVIRAVLATLTLLGGIAFVGVAPTQAALANEWGWHVTLTTRTGFNSANTEVYDGTIGGMAWAENPDRIFVRVERGSSLYGFTFDAPTGRSLRPGFYDGATGRATEARPGMDISGCDVGVDEGHFEIREFRRTPTGEVDRLWLLFYQGCRSGARFGEIRIGVDTALARVEPSTTRWPLTYPGQAGVVLPVRLRAGTGADLQVSDVSVVGPDANAFSVEEDACGGTSVPAEDWRNEAVHTCDVRVRFTPRRSGPHTARLKFSTSQGPLFSSLDGMSRPGQTDWSTTSEGANGIVSAQGTPASGSIACSGGPRTVACSANNESAGQDLGVELWAGTGDVLTPGSYVDDDSGGGPGLVVNRVVSCTRYTGSFDVHQVAYAPHDPSALLRLDASFVRYCDGARPVHGRIRYQASDDTSAPGRVSGLTATRSRGSATLTWTNPADTDHAGTVVRYLPGRTAPPSPVTGIGAYSGNGSRATVGRLDPDATYTFAVFTYDGSGNLSTERVVSVGSPSPEPGPARWYATVSNDLGSAPYSMRADVFDDSNGVLSATAPSNQLDVRASGGVYGREFDWSFTGPDGGPLRPGFYDQVTDFIHPAAGRPRADMYSSEHGPCAPQGYFEIRDFHRLADGTVDRLWLLYEFQCGGSGSVFGELRIGLPSSPVRVESTTIRWPHAGPRVLPTVPVWVRAATSDVTVTGVDIDGPQADDFVLRMDDCTGRTVPAGDRCVVYVRAVPTDPWPRTARLRISTTAGARSVSLDATGPFGNTDWTMTSEAGDAAGRGEQYDFSWDKNSFVVYGDLGRFHAEVGDWSADFRPPNGQRLVEGATYENTTGMTWNDGHPHMVVLGTGGCSFDEVTGWFRVDQVRLGPSGEPDHVDVTFEQRCRATAPALRGRIRYRAQPDLTPPAPASDVSVRRSGDSATLTWTNPSDADLAGTVVRYLPGTTPPPRPDTGIGAYSGTGTSTTVTGLDPHRSYAFAVMTYDTAGNFRQPPPLPLSTRISVAVEPNTVVYGRGTTLSAALTDESGIPLPGEDLRLDSRRTGATRWSPLTTLTTSSHGSVSFDHEPRVNRDYRWVYAGASGLSGSMSPTLSVPVRPRVTALLSDAAVRRNRTVTITGTVSPSQTGQRVSLQRQVNGSWRSLERTTLSSEGKYRFRYTPTSPGERLLQVFRPADAYHASGWSPTQRLVVR